jgi:hypothetical protein
MAQCSGVLYETIPLEFECTREEACEVADMIDAVRADPTSVPEGTAQEIRDAHPERVPPDSVTDPHA